MPAELVGYTVNDLEMALNAMESSLPHAGQAKLTLYTEYMPMQEDIAETYLQMTAAGFHASYPTVKSVQGIAVTEMVLTKGSPIWAALISVLPTLFIVGLIGFGLVNIETITKALLPIVLTVVVGSVVILGLMRRPVERVVEKAAAKYLPQTQKKALAAR